MKLERRVNISLQFVFISSGRLQQIPNENAIFSFRKKAAQRKLENIKDASVEQTAVEFEDQMEVALQTFAPASKRTGNGD